MLKLLYFKTKAFFGDYFSLLLNLDKNFTVVILHLSARLNIYSIANNTLHL